MRLDKLLSFCGFGSRTEVRKLVKQGVVTVDGEAVRDQAMQIDPEAQAVEVNGEAVRYRQHVYIMLNKPEGVISATGDRWHDTVLDLLEGAYAERELFPAGRLDRDTTGLMLLTDDGALAHEILSPKKHVEKVYEAELDRPVNEDDIKAFTAGIDLGDFTAKPANLVILGENRAEVTLTEGKFHQVKRMFEAQGKTVVKLHRRSMGPLMLDPDLKPGDWRELTEEEIKALKEKPDR